MPGFNPDAQLRALPLAQFPPVVVGVAWSDELSNIARQLLAELDVHAPATEKLAPLHFLPTCIGCLQSMGMHRFQTDRHTINLMKRLVVVCGALILVAIACVLCVGWLLAHPVQTRIGNPPADLQAESVIFRSDSGASVHGWWCPVRNRSGAVLLLPGIRANRLSMVDRARFLRGAGYSVMLIDFQATGETKGDHITFGWKESRDVIAAANLIRQIDPASRVAIIGSSLGGVAALLATPPLKVDALISEAAYPTIEIATRNRMENYLGSFGRMLTPVLLNQFQWRLGVSALKLRPVDHIANVECPVFIISGDKDKNTRPGDTRMLAKRARTPKQVWFVPNAGHGDLHRAARQEYETRVLAFLAQMTTSPPESQGSP